MKVLHLAHIYELSTHPLEPEMLPSAIGCCPKQGRFGVREPYDTSKSKADSGPGQFPKLRFKLGFPRCSGIRDLDVEAHSHCSKMLIV